MLFANGGIMFSLKAVNIQFKQYCHYKWKFRYLITLLIKQFIESELQSQCTLYSATLLWHCSTRHNKQKTEPRSEVELMTISVVNVEISPTIILQQ